MTDLEQFEAMMVAAGLPYERQTNVDVSAGGPMFPPTVTQLRRGGTNIWFAEADVTLSHRACQTGQLFDINWSRNP